MMTDLIGRQAAIAYAISGRVRTLPTSEDGENWIRTEDVRQSLLSMPSAEPQWIPCSERLPEDDTEVIVSCTDDSGDSEFSYTTTGWHFKGMWVVGNERSYFVRAWMPLPNLYKGDIE